jgi:hypothetical protein
MKCWFAHDAQRVDFGPATELPRPYQGRMFDNLLFFNRLPCFGPIPPNPSGQKRIGDYSLWMENVDKQGISHAASAFQRASSKRPCIVLLKKGKGATHASR